MKSEISHFEIEPNYSEGIRNASINSEGNALRRVAVNLANFVRQNPLVALSIGLMTTGASMFVASSVKNSSIQEVPVKPDVDLFQGSFTPSLSPSVAPSMMASSIGSAASENVSASDFLEMSDKEQSALLDVLPDFEKKGLLKALTLLFSENTDQTAIPDLYVGEQIAKVITSFPDAHSKSEAFILLLENIQIDVNYLGPEEDSVLELYGLINVAEAIELSDPAFTVNQQPVIEFVNDFAALNVVFSTALQNQSGPDVLKVILIAIDSMGVTPFNQFQELKAYDPGLASKVLEKLAVENPNLYAKLAG